MDNIVEELRQMRAEIRLIGNDLETLGAHFYGIGNFYVWDQLRTRTDRLNYAVDVLDRIGHKILEETNE